MCPREGSPVESPPFYTCVSSPCELPPSGFLLTLLSPCWFKHASQTKLAGMNCDILILTSQNSYIHTRNSQSHSHQQSQHAPPAFHSSSHNNPALHSYCRSSGLSRLRRATARIALLQKYLLRCHHLRMGVQEDKSWPSSCKAWQRSGFRCINSAKRSHHH